MQQQLLRLPRVREATGLARSTIYQLVSENRFPRPIKISERSTAWVASEIQEWVEQRIAASRRVAA